jgi:hypothetical protein
MNRIRQIFAIMKAILSEIFDEASYSRFLRRSNLSPSPDSYAAFWRERESTHARKPRCC